jgi:hypothetical protein
MSTNEIYFSSSFSSSARQLVTFERPRLLGVGVGKFG